MGEMTYKEAREIFERDFELMYSVISDKKKEAYRFAILALDAVARKEASNG